MTTQNTPPKGRLTVHRPSRNLAPTLRRSFHDQGHMPPMRGHVDNEGSLWKGASRIIDRPRKRRLNRTSWRRILADARRAIQAGENIYQAPVDTPSTERGGD